MAGQTVLQTSLGPIEPHVCYPLPDLKNRSGMGSTALRTARATGLRVRYVCGRGFVIGRDFIEWLEANSKDHR